MKILITNDDGWGYDGIQALERIASQLGEVWTVAPLRPMSGISHQMTFEAPMTFEEKGPRSFALDGTPADCVRVAMTQLDTEFDWVFSGINRGANLGNDTFVSGTVAAAREATFFDCNSIAISQHLRKFNEPFDWTKAERLAERFIPQLLERNVSSRTWFNINLPDVEESKLRSMELTETELDPNPLPANYQRTDDGKLLYCGEYKSRPRKENCDIDVCFKGFVSLTVH